MKNPDEKHEKGKISKKTKKQKKKVAGEPLSNKRKSLYKAFISNTYNYGIRYEMTDRNPCIGIKLPKQKKRKIKDIYTPDEATEILKALENARPELRMAIHILVQTGARRGEGLGFEWRDVNYEKSTMSIRQAVKINRELGGTHVGDTKTAESVDIVGVPPYLLDMLKKHKKWQDKQREMLGNKWVDTGYDMIITAWNGALLCPSLPYKWFKDFCKENDFRFCDMHSLRHFGASVLFDRGAPLDNIRRFLRHTSLETTIKYIQRFDDTDTATRNSQILAGALDFLTKKEEVEQNEDS
jgi:integrase